MLFANICNNKTKQKVLFSFTEAENSKSIGELDRLKQV